MGLVPEHRPPGSTPLTRLYPGARYVDWTCVDAYNFGEIPMKRDRWRSFTR